MQIDPNDTLAGVPILEMREALRHARSFIDPQLLRERLGVSAKCAKRIFADLVALGYIEHDLDSGDRWRLSLQGRALANASAAKPIKRTSADRIIAEFIGRVHEVNASEYYAEKVTKVVLFGSYLSDKPTMSDIDVAIAKARKIADFAAYEALRQQRVAAEKERGRTFPNYTAEGSWLAYEVDRFLKSRSRALSLHSYEWDRELIEAGPHRVLYEEPRQTDDAPLT